MWLEHHKRTTVRAKTSFELAAAVADDCIIFRLISSQFKLVGRYPQEGDEAAAARSLASPAMALVLEHGFCRALVSYRSTGTSAGH